MQGLSNTSDSNTTAMNPVVPSTTNSNTGSTSWAQNIITSIRDLFRREPTSEPESDALAAWVGVRKGRGRCRSVGEVH